MRLPTFRARTVAPHRRVRGRAALIVGLHGYGSDETQLDTLVPLDLPIVTVTPRAPHRVEPGWGWWTPEIDPATGMAELAPRAPVDRAVDRVRDLIRSAQIDEGIGPERTAVVGYSQGAALALSVAARHPELMTAVATGAGFLVPDEVVVRPEHPVDVLVLNGTLDPLISEADHRSTVERLTAAGHRVTDQRDPVPHVIDRSQVAVVERHLSRSLIEGNPAGHHPARRPDRGADTQ